MADVIQIKRSDTTSTPSSLSPGELAYSEASGNLFYGRIADGAPVKIGGNTDVSKLAGIEAGAQVNLVDSVAGKTGAVTLVAADITDFNTAADARISASSINDHIDVNVPTPSDQQTLTWDAASGKWIAAASGSGVTTFVALNDTPTAFTGAGGNFVKVNSGETALEYVAGIDGGTF